MRHRTSIFTFLLLCALLADMSWAHAAITLVTGGNFDGAQASSTINGEDVTMVLPNNIQQNDVVVLFGAHGVRASTNIGPINQGYSTASSSNATTPRFGVWYKVMGATPDTFVIGSSTQNALDGACYGYFVLRGVDTSNVLDTTPITAGPTGSTNPDAPAIVTVTANAWVLATADSTAADAAITGPSGYSNHVSAAGNESGGGSTDYTCAGATLEVAGAGTNEDPPSWTNWGNSTWIAGSFAIRPAAVVVAPTVTTASSTSVDFQSANLTGTITATGGENASALGFAYGTDPTLATLTSTSSLGVGFSGTGPFNLGVNGLSTSQTYYFRAYATNNSGGTGYGTIKSFTTGDASKPRRMLLFEGFKIRLISGTMKLLGS